MKVLQQRTRESTRAWRGMRSALPRFGCARGNLSLILAISAPAVLAGFGAAVDYALYTYKKTELQTAADGGAIAAVKELGLANTQDRQIKGAADAYVDHALDDGERTIKTGVTIDWKQSSVAVDIEESWTPVFAHFIGADVTPIRVHAKAALAGSTSICIIALNETASKTLHMDKSARILARGCNIYSNSTSSDGLRLDDRSRIEAALTCSAGGVRSRTDAILPAPVTDCPKVADPLAERPEPPVGGCDWDKTTISAGAVVLKPGTYCDGLVITGTAEVTFAPGTYVVTGGPLRIAKNATVTGSDVSFYLHGDKAVIDFDGNTAISLKGAEGGSMAGLLFFEDRSVKTSRKHRIQSANARVLTGTIYLSRGYLLVNPNAPVAQDSAYTAIVANRLEVQEGPQLVLNSDYQKTKVPVPEGIQIIGRVVLTE